MTVSTIEKAWKAANEIFPTDYIKDETATERAGYPIYRSTASDNNGYISDLGDRLELNTDDGNSINIWIEDTTDTESPAQTKETTIRLETIITRQTSRETTTTTKGTHLALSHETTLHEISRFEREARLLIKGARATKKSGDRVTVTLTKATYRFSDWSDLVQESFELWVGEGDRITADGVHLCPSEQYNKNLSHDMWITGTKGELFDELTI